MNLKFAIMLSIVPRMLQSSVAFAPGQRIRSASRLFLLDKLFGSSSTTGLPVICEESVMDQKSHGTSEKPVQKDLRWDCDFNTADRICNFNRHYAEYAGYWQTTEFLKFVKEEYKEGEGEPLEFYDSVTGKLLFKAPIGRSMADFLKESASHGWPSFRDEEVVWDYVRCLRNGECVSTTGTHLGHNIPDGKGNRYVRFVCKNSFFFLAMSHQRFNRYCINLVSVAGKPEE